MIEKIMVAHCIMSETTAGTLFTPSHELSDRIMKIGQMHKNKKFKDILRDESYAQWVQGQDPGHEDLKAFKEYSSLYLEIKESLPGPSRVHAFELMSDKDELKFFKMVTKGQLERAELSYAISALLETVVWLSKGIISTIFIGANFSQIEGLKQLFILKFKWNPYRILN